MKSKRIDNLTKEIVEKLTVEDLLKNPKLALLLKKDYPKAYWALTSRMPEMSLMHFIKIAEAQKETMEKMAELAPHTVDPPKNLKHAIRVIKNNGLGANAEVWFGGVPFKFELSRFVEHYASECRHSEWRQILKEIGASKSNYERILDMHKNKFKNN